MKHAFVPLCILLWSHASYASTQEPLSVEQLAAVADQVVVGRCVQVKTAYVRIPTATVTVAVDETWKGKPERTVSFTTVTNGKPNRFLKTFVTGAPDFSTGERVVLFLEHGPGGTPRLVGFGQGKLSVLEDEHGRAVVARGAIPLGLRGGKLPAGAAKGLPSLAELKARVRAGTR